MIVHATPQAPQTCAFPGCEHGITHILNPTTGYCGLTHHDQHQRALGNTVPADDPVEPSHYTRLGAYSPVDVIEIWGLDFNLGNAIKYIGRAGHKDPTKYTEDLKKAAWYLSRAIERAERS